MERSTSRRYGKVRPGGGAADGSSRRARLFGGIPSGIGRGRLIPPPSEEILLLRGDCSDVRRSFEMGKAEVRLSGGVGRLVGRETSSVCIGDWDCAGKIGTIIAFPPVDADESFGLLVLPFEEDFSFFGLVSSSSISSSSSTASSPFVPEKS